MPRKTEPRKEAKCTLRRLPDETPVRPGDVERRDFDGEIDVTGASPPNSDANQYDARARAEEKAFAYFSRKYRCIGDCGGRLCALKVKVLGNKSAMLGTRRIAIDPDSPLGRRGVREVTKHLLQITITATVECGCIERPVLQEPPRPLPPVSGPTWTPPAPPTTPTVTIPGSMGPDGAWIP